MRNGEFSGIKRTRRLQEKGKDDREEDKAEEEEEERNSK